MIAGTASFSLVDVMVKLTSAHLPIGEIIVLRNAIATALIVAVAASQGRLCANVALPPQASQRLLALRMIGEAGSTLAFLSALALMPIADAISIAQVTPLLVTAAAAVFLREPVGARRWAATAAGFLGVLLIIQPGSSTASWPAVLVLVSLGFIVLRDLATRAVPTHISTLTLALMSSVATGLSGFLLLPFETWMLPTPTDLARLTVAAASLSLGYAFMVMTMRTGDISAAAPFRYTTMLFALLSGYLIWNELPNAIALLGAAIVVAAGLYTCHRERRQIDPVQVPGVI